MGHHGPVVLRTYRWPWLRAVLLDSGDTLVDEGTEIRLPGSEVVTAAELIPGAGEMVRALVDHGVPLGLVADGWRASFENVLGTQHGLIDCFDAVAISEGVGAVKPAAAMFERALTGLGVGPDRDERARVVMVGNHLERDIAGGNALGLISVWMDWAPRRPKAPASELERPQHRITSPSELIPLLDRLF